MKLRLIPCALAALALLAACAPATTPAPTATATPLATATFTAVPPSATVPPTETTAPTATFTAEPSATATEEVIAITPTLTPTATAGAATPRPTTSGGGDFSPTAASVWNAPATTDTGTCATPLPNPVYGPVQITPAGETLTLRDTEVQNPYTFSKTGANTFVFSGAAPRGDGTLNMVLVFTSATTFQLTRTYVYTTDPNCAHVYQYQGTFQWNS